MITETKDVMIFLRAQQEVVIAIGAYLAPLLDFLKRCQESLDYANDANNLLRLQRHLVDERLLKVTDEFMEISGYEAYRGYVRGPYGDFLDLLARQTIEKHRDQPATFVQKLTEQYERLASVMITLAKLPPPRLDANIKAGSPFEAYCFFRSILSEQAQKAYLFDPYVDASVFYLYLYALPSNAEVRIVTSPSKWKEKVRKEFEAVESLFKQEYPNYDRIDADDLHDRHLIVNGVAYSLGGSLKDAAKKADFHVKEVSQEIGEELINKYIRSKESM